MVPTFNWVESMHSPKYTEQVSKILRYQYIVASILIKLEKISLIFDKIQIEIYPMMFEMQ